MFMGGIRFTNELYLAIGYDPDTENFAVLRETVVEGESVQDMQEGSFAEGSDDLEG